MHKYSTWWRLSLPRRRRPSTFRSHHSRRARLEPLEPRLVLSTPTMPVIPDVTLLAGSPYHIPLGGYDADGQTLCYTAVSDNADVTTFIPEGNRSMRISAVDGEGAVFGDMVFELFEGRVPRATEHIIELAESGFYDGIIFHRVIDNFMIQGGDPTGTGTGGSPLGEFDDQFHVDLQHNRPGLLSMAKSTDDSNDCQFYIIEVPTRYLDYNHSIFGLLVEGDDVREAISNVGIDEGTDRPLIDVIMDQVVIFEDNQNGVLMLKAPHGTTGEATITLTVVDEDQNEFQRQFHVTVVEDTGVQEDSDPFLADIPEIRTSVDTEVTFQLTAIDVEGDPAIFLDEDTLDANSLFVPYRAHPDMQYSVDFYTGEVTVTPTAGLYGVQYITVATAAYGDAVDYQVVPILIAPDVPVTSGIEMTVGRHPTATDYYGEVAELADGPQWIDEWDSFSVEIWVGTPDFDESGIRGASVDLTFDTEYFTATVIEHGPAFTDEQTGTIDNGTGAVRGIGGTTGRLDLGDDGHVLLARVLFEPKPGNPNVEHNSTGQYCTPLTGFVFALSNGQVDWVIVDSTNVGPTEPVDLQIWPVIYDIDDNDEIGLGDLAFFASAYQQTVGQEGSHLAWAADFDHSGEVGINDLSFFASNYGRGRSEGVAVSYPANFTADWQGFSEQAAPLGHSGGAEGSAPAVEQSHGWKHPVLLQYGPAWAQSDALQDDTDRPADRDTARIVDLLMLTGEF